MSGTNKNCSECQQPILDKRFLRCAACKDNYDLLCAGVSEQRFYNTLTRNRRANWRCPLCVTKQPKSDNTPVRSAHDGVMTRRGGSATQPPMDVSILGSDIINDTAHDVTEGLSPTNALITEMRLFREQLMVASTRMGALNDTMIKLSSRMDAYEERVNRLEERMHVLEERVEVGGGVVKTGADGSLLAIVEQLKAQLNDRDQEALMKYMEISCVQETKGENLMHVVATLVSKIGVTLKERGERGACGSCARNGRRRWRWRGGREASPNRRAAGTPRRARRDGLLREARVRRGATTEGTGLPGSPQRFYFNERLNRPNRQLFRRAREIGSRLGWRFVWTRDGNVFARQRHDPNAPRHRLRTEQDLIKVFGAEAVGAASVVFQT